jgi:hypothetical protein
MALLGSLIALGAALIFAALGLLTLWAGWLAVRREVLRGFVSAAPSPAEQALTLGMIGLPLGGAALLGLLAAIRIAAVALGIGQ